MALRIGEAEVVLGTMKNAGVFNGLFVEHRDVAASHAVLRQAYAAGIRSFDTAPIYARCHAEADLGACFQDQPEAELWTKVGVDTTTPLPQLDYSFDGMCRSLEASLGRLRRPQIVAVLIHNPDLRVVDHQCIRDFGAWAREHAKASQIGISTLYPSQLTSFRLDSADWWAMCEPGRWAGDAGLRREIRSRFRLALRSLFGGGGMLRHGSVKKRRELMRTAFAEAITLYDPEAIVVGARTGQHLEDLQCCVAELR